MRRGKLFRVALIILPVLLAFAGCVRGPSQEEFPDSAEIFEQFDTIAARDIVGVSHIIDFMDKNMDSVTKEHGARMILRLEEKQKEYLQYLEQILYTEEVQEKFREEDDFSKDISNPEELTDPYLRELVADMNRSGFKIERAEGSYFPIIDYAFFEKYSKYVTAEIRQYLRLMQAESDRASMADGALAVTWEELMQRALDSEDFLTDYPESKKKEEVATLFDRYRNALLNGLPNTPIFDYTGDNMLKAEVRSVFENALEKGRESQLLKDLVDFLGVLEESDYRLTEEVETFLEDRR